MRRKKPFSGKAKKKQLMERRQRRSGIEEPQDNSVPNSAVQPKRGLARPPMFKDLRTVFAPVSQAEMDARLKIGHQPLEFKSTGGDSIEYGIRLDIPLRPKWSYSDTKEELEERESSMFDNYLSTIYSSYPTSRLNFFEHNLEVWRELWRTCEVSDVLLVLADCRHPLLHFPPSLYRFVVDILGKPMILVLTKADLIPEDIVNTWVKFFQKHFPALDDDEAVTMGAPRRKANAVRRRGAYYRGGAAGVVRSCNQYIIDRGFEPLPIPTEFDSQLLSDHPSRTAIQPNYSNDSNLRSITSENSLELTPIDVENNVDQDELDSKLQNDDIEDEDGELDHDDMAQKTDDDEDMFHPVEKNYLTFGFIGSPNVGKSSLINTLVGRKVCSTSRSPGHTKHRQTYFLTPSVRLCDCPGLVFPALDVPRPLQVVAGVFPISQVREPYTSIRYIAERISLPDLLKLEKVNEDIDWWSAFEICEAYALKRGYHTSRGRLDAYRAGLEMLRDYIDGRIVMYSKPDKARLNLALYEDSRSNLSLIEPSEFEDHLDPTLRNAQIQIPNEYVPEKDTETSSNESDNEDSDVSNSNMFAVLDEQD